MQRYFVSKEIINKDLGIAKISDKENVHHIRDVMRFKNGDEIILLTNDELEYLCIISDISNSVSLIIKSERINNNELNAEIDIAHGLVRKEKREETLRRLVELGCHKYIPVMMERSIVKMDKYKENNDRIKTIIKECSEQSERGKMLEYNDVISFKDLIKVSKSYDYLFVCFEDSGRSNEKALNSYLGKLKNKKVLVLIGPEGGISNTELSLLKDNGFIPIGLGKRILRTETAPLFIMSILGYMVEVGDANE